MPNTNQLKEVQKIAAKLKKDDPKLKHRDAVSQAWKQLKADKADTIDTKVDSKKKV